MTSVSNWFSGLLTIAGLMYFLFGFASAYIIHCVRQKMQHRQARLPWQLAGIAVGTVAIIVVTFQSSDAYNQAKDTADEVQQCSREFHEALITRSRIASENDEISQDQRRILHNWLHDIVFPPEPYTSLQPNDPRRQEWGIARTVAADRAMKRLFDKQDVLQRQRDASPLPDPTCGKG